MPDLDRYLYDHLRSHAAGVDVPPGDIDVVTARGRQRRHRRAGAGVLAVVAAAGTVTGVVVTDSNGGGHGQISVGSPTSLPAATGQQLNWRVVPTTAGLSDLTSLSSSGSAAYAVSTAPGVVPDGGQMTEQLYRSADGLSWTTATGPAGFSAAGVALDGNRVYTVGTGPATAATGVSGAMTTAVSWSDDSGSSWQNSVLPVALNAPAGAVTVNDEAVNVAAGAKGVVATVGINATVDLSKLVSGVTAKTLWAAGANGVEVLGSQISSRCGTSVVTKSASGFARNTTVQLKQAAAQKAASGAAQASGVKLQQARTLYAATPGSPEGQLTTVPCVGANGQVTSSVPADQAYRVTQTYSWSQLNIDNQLSEVLQGEPLVFSSPNGTNFQLASPLAGTSGPGYVTATPGGFAMVVSNSSGSGTPAVLQSVDGQQWTDVPFGMPSDATGATGIGYVDGHVVVVGDTQTGSAAYTLLSDGWQTAALPADVTAVSFGPLGVGAVGVSAGGAPESWVVLFSPDGVHWSSASLDTLSGGTVNDANVLVGAQQVVVTMSRPPSGQPPASGPGSQVQLVGTPAA